MQKKENTSWKTVFKNASENIGILLREKEIALFEKYLLLLEEWNKKINITAIKSREEIAIKHFIDSLSVLKHVSLSGKIADLGSGGGFPGIPLKIVEPALDLVLIEPIRKRANFLRTAVTGLKLEKISVFNGRTEDFPENGIFDFTISRALADLKTFCVLSVPILKPGGYMVAMKGRETDAEIEKTKVALPEIKIVQKTEFELPGKSGSRSILVLQKCFT